jgi:hypothetical protein
MCTLPGDVNLDGQVSLSDLNNLLNNYGSSGNWSAGDVNYDGQVSLSDLNYLLNNYGSSAPASYSLVVGSGDLASPAASFASPAVLDASTSQATGEVSSMVAATPVATAEESSAAVASSSMPVAAMAVEAPVAPVQTDDSSVTVVSDAVLLVSSGSDISSLAATSGSSATPSYWLADRATKGGVNPATLLSPIAATVERGSAVVDRAQLLTAVLQETDPAFGQGQSSLADLTDAALLLAKQRLGTNNQDLARALIGNQLSRQLVDAGFFVSARYKQC